MPATFVRLFGCLLFLTLFSSVGCNKGGDPNTIKIVSSLPRTGSAEGQTTSITNGIKMAFEEVDYKVGNFKIEYADWNDAISSSGNWDSAAEINNANLAASDRDCMVYLGPFNSGAAKASMPILNQAGLLMISPANTAIGLTKPSGVKGEPENYRPTGKINYVRVVATDDLQGTLAADWAKQLGVKKVYILDDSEMYGKGCADLFERRCNEIGVTVLGHEQISVKANDFKSIMNKIKALGPDLVYFGGTTQSKGGQIAKDMSEVNLDCKMMVPEGCFEEAFITAAGAESVNGRCYVTFPGLPAKEMTGTGKEFYERYKKKYNAEPEPYAIYGYECGKVALESIKKAGKKDRAAIVAACLGLKDFEGALGKWSFDANGDTTLQRLSGFEIRNGKFEFVTMLEAGADAK
jgi:branched-chain amino acid transport system substrate-binding protein